MHQFNTGGKRGYNAETKPTDPQKGENSVTNRVCDAGNYCPCVRMRICETNVFHLAIPPAVKYLHNIVQRLCGGPGRLFRAQQVR